MLNYSLSKSCSSKGP